MVRALIIGPTRELTEQTHQAVCRLGGKTGIRSASIYGGVSILPQIGALRRGVDIVSACPGRLLDHINRGTINVSTVEVLVLDEADLMFDMGFFPDIQKIVKQLPAGRQTLLFTATMPDDVLSLAKETMRDPVRVQIGHTAPADTVAHTFYPVETHLKTALLKHILSTTETGPVLVFTRTKMRASSVGHKLAQAGYPAIALHGNLSQNKRQEALDGFRSGRYKVLVATDVAARGIDVCGVSHVINYDIPETARAYTHRIGRTGRACKTGDAFTFVLYGDLGAGKTHLSYGIARGLEVKEQYNTSPTFAFVHQYEGRIPFYHIDLYRLKDASELDSIGFEEYVDSDGATVKEWAERAEEELPDEKLNVYISDVSENSREIGFFAEGERYEKLLDGFKKNISEDKYIAVKQ